MRSIVTARVMTADDVIEVVRFLESHGISVWLDGGWGVDALLGEQRRSHKDLDLVMSLQDTDAAMRLLNEHGFALVQGGAPKSFVLEDPRGRSLDIHPVRFDDGGDGVYRLDNDEDWIYPAAGFPGSGVVAGQPVRCLTPSVQMLCHTGYEFGDKDIAEVLALHDRFGVDVPEAYRRYLKRSEP